MSLKEMSTNQKLFLVLVVVLVVSSGAFGIRSRIEGWGLSTGGGGGGALLYGIFEDLLSVGGRLGESGATGETGATGATGESGADAPPVENWRYPTTIFVTANPDNIPYGNWFYGAVTSDGYSYSISILATHLGSGETETIPGFVAPDGTYESSPMQMNTPGFWTFVVTSENGVVSNTATLRVRGITTNVSPTYYSQSLGSHLSMEVFSDLPRQNAVIFANYPASGVSKPITTLQTNDYGYIFFNYEPDGMFWPRGDYELSCDIGGVGPDDTSWFRIGR